jgi:outer membrane autotransporter protein
MNGMGSFASRLSAGVALAAIIGVASPALAADECGVPVNGQVICTSAGNPYATGVTYSAPGNLNVSTNSDASLAGTLSVTSTGGTTTVVSAGPVTTNATNSDGIDATGNGNVSVTAGAVSTTAADSAGIIAISNTGNVTVSSTSVSVASPGGAGILALAPGSITITSGSASAIDSSAIFANAVNGPASVAVTGAVTSAKSDSAIVVNSGSSIAVNIASTATVTGTNGLTLNSQTGSTVTNAGTLTGTNGYAVLVNHGSATIINSGTMGGRLGLTGANNNVTNSGTFIVNGLSNFGTGTNTFTNSGIVQVSSSAPTAGLNFLGLTAFNNSGTVSLANGRAGDLLTLPGTFTGSGASTLTLDVNLSAAANAADKLVIGGAATGSTTVVLVNPGSGPALLHPTTILVQAGAGSSAGAFQLAPASTMSGFIRYDLTYAAATNAYSLVTTPSVSAYRPLKYIEGARNNWYKSSDVWSAHMRTLRDTPGTSGRLWGQIYGAVDTRDGGVAGLSGGENLSYRQDYFGGQLGLDIARPGDKGGLGFGVTAGYLSSHLNFPGTSDQARYDAWNIGVYASFNAGPLFFNALGKYDYDHIDGVARSAGFTDKFHGHAIGATGELGYRGESGGFYFEPLLTLSYTRTELGTFAGAASLFDFRDADGLRGKAGLRAGKSIDIGGGHMLGAYVGGNAVKEFRGRDELDFINNDITFRLRNQRIGLYGEGYGGFTILTAGGVSGFLEGYGDFGQADTLRGGGGRAGIRIAM